LIPQDLVQHLLTAPSPEDLVALHGLLLDAEADPVHSAEARAAGAVAGEFHAFLCDLRSKLSAREYSNVASLMDIAAVGAAALEGIADPSKITLRQIGLAALSETLMVLASRQYVKAWSRELRPVALRAAWRLREELWRLSIEGQPEMAGTDRQQAIDALLAPVVSDAAPPEVQHALIARLFQVVLLIRVTRALGPADAARA
jgi:hypothetical protein